MPLRIFMIDAGSQSDEALVLYVFAFVHFMLFTSTWSKKFQLLLNLSMEVFQYRSKHVSTTFHVICMKEKYVDVVVFFYQQWRYHISRRGIAFIKFGENTIQNRIEDKYFISQARFRILGILAFRLHSLSGQGKFARTAWTEKTQWECIIINHSVELNLVLPVGGWCDGSQKVERRGKRISDCRCYRCCNPSVMVTKTNNCEDIKRKTQNRYSSNTS